MHDQDLLSLLGMGTESEECPQQVSDTELGMGLGVLDMETR